MDKEAWVAVKVAEYEAKARVKALRDETDWWQAELLFNGEKMPAPMKFHIENILALLGPVVFEAHEALARAQADSESARLLYPCGAA